MKDMVVRALLRLYPAQWRREYGKEMEDLLRREPLSPSVTLDVVWNALWLHGRTRDHPGESPRPLTLLIGGMSVFTLSATLAGPLWHLISTPAVEAMRHSGISPGLIQITPGESFQVICVKLPLLIAAFLSYLVVLCLARIWTASHWGLRSERWVTALVICSGGLFLLSGILSSLSWRYGSVITVRGLEPAIPAAYIMTVSDCFGRFAWSTVQLSFLIQIPVLVFFVASRFSSRVNN